MFKYAEGTEVSEAKSRMDIEDLLEKFGVTDFITRKQQSRVDIAFSFEGLNFQIGIDLPDLMKERRRLWRVLQLQVKSNLIAVAEGLVTMEQAFMANIVTDDGRTLGDRMAPSLEAARGKSGSLALPARFP